MMRRIRVDRRTVLGAVLAIVSAVAVLAATRPAPVTGVLVAGADLAPGVALGEQAVEIRPMSDPEGLIAADDPTTFADWAPAAPLDAGEPIPASLLRPAARGTRPDAVALALGAEHAVLGELRSGDRVDVFVTAPAPESGEPSTTLVAEQVYVLEIVDDTDGLAGSPTTNLLLAADRELAAVLIHAVRTGDVDLVRVGR